MSVSKRSLKVRAICLPDTEQVVGGVKQLYRHIEHLSSMGYDAAVVCEEAGFRPSWFNSSCTTVPLHETFASGCLSFRDCVLLVPETYLDVDWSDFYGLDLSRFARVVFNQNAYYTFDSDSVPTAQALASFYDDPSVLHIFSVSDQNHRFLSRNLGLPDHRLSRIVNAVEPFFRPDLPKCNHLHWMPRKNPDHVKAIFLGLTRGGLRFSQGWKARPLNDLSHQQVAEHLNQGRIFLSFGYPEGFGLPVMEAMASGCWVVGYSGGGGDELFGFGASRLVSFGDWCSFHAGIEEALQSFAVRPRETQLLIERQALAVQTLYSQHQEYSSIERAWDRVTMAFQQWRQVSLNE